MRHAIVGCLAVSLLAHAGLVIWAGDPAPRAKTRTDARLNVRLVASAQLPPAAAVAAPRPARRPAVRKAAAVRAPVEPPAPAPAPIDGSVFALPRIGFGGTVRPSRWVSPPPAPAMPPPPSALLAQAHALREAGRMQIMQALQQQVSAWRPPEEEGDGACALQPPAAPACDSDALLAAVSTQASSLAGLLDAYRSVAPGSAGLSIAFTQGRYQVWPAR